MNLSRLLLVIAALNVCAPTFACDYEAQLEAEVRTAHLIQAELRASHINSLGVLALEQVALAAKIIRSRDGSLTPEEDQQAKRHALSAMAYLQEAIQQAQAPTPKP